jgi:hypothetical protein
MVGVEVSRNVYYCSAMGRPLIDISGQKFGRITAISHIPKTSFWICKCECGKEKNIQGSDLRRGFTRSCGCWNSEVSSAKATHGKSRTLEYAAWGKAKERCTKPSSKGWKYYGARGIKMHPEWIESFEKFIDYLGPKPGPHYTVDRIDNNGNYEPGNVRWATMETQSNNKRNNVTFYIGNKKWTIARAARHFNVCRSSLQRRIRSGQSPKEAIQILQKFRSKHHLK